MVDFGSKETLTQYVLITHQVADYMHWKSAFDRAAGIRKAAGEIDYQVLRSHSDSNLIVHLSRWSSLNDAKQFFESKEVEEIRRAAGVKAPKFMYLDQLVAGTL